MNRTSIALILGFAAVACRTDGAPVAQRRTVRTSASSGLEQVTILARGME